MTVKIALSESLLTPESLNFVGLDKCRVQRRAEGARGRRLSARRKLRCTALRCTYARHRIDIIHSEPQKRLC